MNTPPIPQVPIADAEGRVAREWWRWFNSIALTLGDLGKVVDSEVLVAHAVALTDNVAVDVTSISLTVGDWYVTGSVYTNPNAGTTMTVLEGWISTVAATAPAPPNQGGMTVFFNPAATASSTNSGFPVGVLHLSLTEETTVYLGVLSRFAGSTNAAYGFLSARPAG